MAALPRSLEHLSALAIHDVSVLNVVFRSPDATYGVVLVHPIDPTSSSVEGQSSTSFVAVGEAVALLQAGMRVTVIGTWETVERFGRRLRVYGTIPLWPTTQSGMRALLGSGVISGLSPAFAVRIVDRFQASTLDVLATCPERLLEIEGVYPAAVEALSLFMHARQEVVNSLAVLCLWGVSASVATRIVLQYGRNACQIVQSTPYRVLEIEGLTFVQADGVASCVGVSGSAEIRITAGLIHVLEEAARQGHVCYPTELLLRAASALLDLPRELVVGHLSVVQQQGELVEEEGVWYLPRLRQAESGIESSVGVLVRAPLLESFMTGSVETLALTPLQDLAVKRALSYPLSVVTGLTGTGKTLVVGAVVRQARRIGLSVVLCAPSPKAAARVSQKTGLPALPVMRVLEHVAGHGYRRTQVRPIDADLVVMDEASYLGVEDAESFFHAVDPERTGVMLAGDDRLRMPCGPGDVLRDLIQSGLCPITRLDEVDRQAAQSSIVRLAHQISVGRLPEITEDWGENHHWRLGDDPAEIMAQLLTVIDELVAMGVVSRAGCQVLVPFRGGPLGSESVNRVLQAAAYPLPCRSLGPFRLGDRVIHLGDDYVRELCDGDIGRVCEVDEGYLYVSFEHRVVPFVASQLSRLELAYCLPIAKAQWSQFPCVILILHTSEARILCRDLVYGAMTRAEQQLVLMGSAHAYRIAAQASEAPLRYSGLFRRAMTRITL